MIPTNLETEVRIYLNAPPVTPQRYSVWNKITSLPSSQKGLLIALSIQSICSIVATGVLFSIPDPPQNDSLGSNFIGTPIISANCHKWSLFVGSLVSNFVTGTVFTYFLQENKETIASTITPEIATAIQNSIERKLHSLEVDSTHITVHI
jgi:uncharacterized membrane-anchored protein YitT (DUF2179 family)